MEVLLRRGSTLERACKDAAAKIDINPLITLSVLGIDQAQLETESALGSATAILAGAQDTLAERIKDVFDLREAAYTIRLLVGQANAAKVQPLLTERDFLNAIEKIITTLLEGVADKKSERHRIYGDREGVRVKHDKAQLTQTIRNLRQRLTVAGEVSDRIEVVALSSHTVESLEQRLASIRRRRIDLNEALALANIEQKITLPDAVVKVLVKYGIIE
jgi:hypothetical protein